MKNVGNILNTAKGLSFPLALGSMSELLNYAIADSLINNHPIYFHNISQLEGMLAVGLTGIGGLIVSAIKGAEVYESL